MIPAFEHHPNCRFLGFPMSQNRYAVPAWSYLLEVVQPKRIIEIGTSVGGMSCLLALAARKTGATFDTFDVGFTVDSNTAILLSNLCGDGRGFHRNDVFDDLVFGGLTVGIRDEGLSLILCDGGNKVKEFRTFAPFLKSGDIIAAHDFGGREFWPWEEIRIEDVSDVIEKENLVRFMEDVFENTGWLVCRKT